MADLNNIKIGDSNPDLIMFNEPLNRLKTSVFDWYKFANDAGGYYVRGLWLAPVSPWGVYSWPWDLGVTYGALKDVNNGWARWGYVRDGSGKNITKSMTQNFAENVSGNYHVAITIWFNTPNYTDEDGNEFLDISDNPIVITFNDGRFDDYNWVMKTGAIAEWSEDKRTITIKRIPAASHVVCQSNNTDKTIAKVREDLYNVYADVSGLSINDGIDFTDKSSVECWNAYMGDTQIYHKDRNLENCWKKYGYVAGEGDYNGYKNYTEYSVKEYVIKIPSGEDILPKLDDYSDLAHCKFHNVVPVNTEVWDDIRKWYRNNTIEGSILAVPSITDDGGMYFSKAFYCCTGFSELTLNLNYPDYYTFNYGEDNWNGTDIEEITFNTNKPISSPQRWFRGMSKLKTINFSNSSMSYLCGAASVVDMFGGCNVLEEYPSNLINWESYRQYNSGYASRNYTLTQYAFNNCYKLKKVPSYTSGDSIVCNGLSMMFNNCQALTTIEPILDVAEQLCNPSNASNWFAGCNSLTSVKIKGLSHGDWYFDGTTNNDVTHGDLSNLDEDSVKYLFDNLTDLTTCDNLINTKQWWNSWDDWTGLNEWAYIDDGELVIDWAESPEDYVSGTIEVSGEALPEDLNLELSYAGIDFIDASGEVTIRLSGGTEYVINPGSEEVTYLIPAGTTGISIEVSQLESREVLNMFLCREYIDGPLKWSSRNPLVSSASLNCPSAWNDKITEDMIAAANSKGWTVNIATE